MTIPTDKRPTRRLRRRVGQSFAAVILTAALTGVTLPCPNHQATGEAISCRAPIRRLGFTRVLRSRNRPVASMLGSGGCRRPSAGLARSRSSETTGQNAMRLNSEIVKTNDRRSFLSILRVDQISAVVPITRVRQNVSSLRIVSTEKWRTVK